MQYVCIKHAQLQELHVVLTLNHYSQEVKFFKYKDCGVILLKEWEQWKKQKEDRMQNTCT